MGPKIRNLTESDVLRALGLIVQRAHGEEGLCLHCQKPILFGESVTPSPTAPDRFWYHVACLLRMKAGEAVGPRVGKAASH